MVDFAARGAVSLLAVMAVFQAALAWGAPLGYLSWGGRFSGRLPAGLRIGSAVAIVVLAVAGWVVLTRAGILPGNEAQPEVAIDAWVFAGLFGLNTLGNLASTSKAEKMVMTPISAALCICFAIVAYS